MRRGLGPSPSKAPTPRDSRHDRPRSWARARRTVITLAVSVRPAQHAVSPSGSHTLPPRPTRPPDRLALGSPAADRDLGTAGRSAQPGSLRETSAAPSSPAKRSVCSAATGLQPVRPIGLLERDLLLVRAFCSWSSRCSPRRPVRRPSIKASRSARRAAAGSSCRACQARARPRRSRQWCGWPRRSPTPRAYGPRRSRRTRCRRAADGCAHPRTGQSSRALITSTRSRWDPGHPAHRVTSPSCIAPA